MSFSKICLCCGIEKPFSEYTLKRGKPNAQCKPCRYTKDKIYRENNKDKIADKNKRNWLSYKGTERQKEVNRNKCKTYRKNNPEKFRFHTSKRRALKIQATPEWADLKEIETFYLNCPNGFEVDHIVPLNSSIVCGLHVIDNLQYLSIEENRQKSNKFQIN